MSAQSAARLTIALAPVACAAWWLATFREELATRPALHIVIAGASQIECMDEGRWFSYLPWMMGNPSMRVRWTLVGNELMTERGQGSISSSGASLATLRRKWETPMFHSVRERQPAEIFNGLLGQWRATSSQEPDAYLLFAPGMESHHDSWLTDDELLPLLRCRAPVGFFPYSRMDGYTDMYFMEAYGLRLIDPVLRQCPWGHGHEGANEIGAFGQFGWDVRADVPETITPNDSAIREFAEAMDYLKPDFMQEGDLSLERLGARWEVRSKDRSVDDAIIVLPRHHAILESTRAVGEFDEQGFSPFEPPLAVAPGVLDARPPEDQVLRRVLWAAQVHREFVDPELDGDEHDGAEAPLFPAGLTLEALKEGVRAIAKRALGRDVDPDDLIAQIRLSGGLHGGTHPAWFDLLETIGWKPKDYVEDPERLEPAFTVIAPRRGIKLPVICEAYALMPDDVDDDLANEAMEEVSDSFPDGAFLLFRHLPHCKVNGHEYSFGGMLYWQGEWRQFALNRHMISPDAVLDQVESGFVLGNDDPRYADDLALAIPFNCMCQGLDPNERVPMMGLRSGNWTTALPTGEE